MRTMIERATAEAIEAARRGDTWLAEFSLAMLAIIALVAAECE